MVRGNELSASDPPFLREEFAAGGGGGVAFRAPSRALRLDTCMLIGSRITVSSNAVAV